MTKEDKQLLLKDLCARLPYGVKIHVKGEYKRAHKIDSINVGNELASYFEAMHLYDVGIVNCMPYLRPRSEIANLISAKEFTQLSGVDLIDWYNANHIDYRGLIPKNLAIEAPVDMYKL